MSATRTRHAALLGALLLIAVGGAAAAFLLLAEQRPPALIFVVLDTVRSQNTSLCGYERPTTPTLAQLAGQGATVACRAIAPSSWTLPSHASFFTGLEQFEHGAGAGPGKLDLGWGSAVPLHPDHTTLAEALAARGYQTVAISANPVLTPASGLLQGFEATFIASSYEELRGDAFAARVRAFMANRDTSRPLFLFLNLADAHNPWPAVPEGIVGVPPTEAMHGAPERRAYEMRLLSPEQQRELRQDARNLYDYGVLRADLGLAMTLSALEEQGWFAHGMRLVVTSDHGEYLGEHERLLHGGWGLFEEVVRVPLLVFDTEGSPPLPDPISATAAYDLLLTGALADRPVRAATFSHRGEGATAGDGPCGVSTAAEWEGDGKRTCYGGRFQAWDLKADPHEANPNQADVSAAFRRFTEQTEARARAIGDDDIDSDLTDSLKQLGYIEE